MSEERRYLGLVILNALNIRPVRRFMLEKIAINACGTLARFKSTFEWLKQTGRIRKIAGKRTSPYEITESGKRLLDALRDEFPEKPRPCMPERWRR